MIRTLAALAVLLLALGGTMTPVARTAAATSETTAIRLRYYPAAEMSRFLDALATMTPRYVAVRFGVDPETEPKLPTGLATWTADPSDKLISVTGTGEAIRELKESLVSRLDTPLQRVRLRARVLQLDAAAVEALKPDNLGIEGGAEGVELIMPSRERIASLDSRPTLVRLDTRAWTNLPVHLRWNGADKLASGSVTIVQRMNSDRTLTFFATLETVESGNPGILFRELQKVRRVGAGQSLVLIPHLPGPGLLLTAPDPEKVALAPAMQEYAPQTDRPARPLPARPHSSHSADVETPLPIARRLQAGLSQ